MSVKDALDVLSQFGVMGFAVLALYAFLTDRIVTRGRLDEQRADKREAIDLAKDTVKAMDRLTDAVEARNRLEETRTALERDRSMR